MKWYFILLQALKFFFLQTLIEVILMVILLHLGVSYFDMNVGNEHFYEIIVGVLGYYALTKCIYYSWIYLIAFTGVGVIGKLKSLLSFSIVNAFLSIGYIILFLINGRLFSWVVNPLIASLIASFIIILLARHKPVNPYQIPL